MIGERSRCRGTDRPPIMQNLGGPRDDNTGARLLTYEPAGDVENGSVGT